MKKIVLLFFFLTITITNAFSQNNCGNNADFESGTIQGWVCKSGSYGSGICPPVGNCPAFQTNLPAIGILNPDGNDALGTGNNRHTIMDHNYRPWGGPGVTGMDSISGNTISVVPPGGGNYSFRLGNAIGGGTGTIPNYAQAEAIRLTFLVSPSNAGFIYKYSAFLQDTIHGAEAAPRFEVNVFDSAEKIIPCGNYSFIADTSNPYCTGIKDTGYWHQGVGLWKYTDWTDVGLDLSFYIGQTISIEFRTADCFEKDTGTCNYKPGPHSAYAYIDAFCSPLTIIGPAIDSIDCGKPYTLCAYCPGPMQCYYLWSPGSETTQCITVTNPTSGSIYTLDKSTQAGCPIRDSIILACIVGVNELSNNKSFSIYPNPATTSSTLQLNTQLKNAEVIIYDMLGHEMMRKKMNGDRMEIERGSLESGVYFVRVRAGERQSAGGRIRWGEWVEKMVVE